MRLQQNEIEIVDFLESDINSKINIINTSNNNKYLHYDLPLRYEDTLKWFKNKNNTNRLDCTIRYNNQICGFIGLLNIDRKNCKAEYYICVDYNFSGKKIGYIASKLLIEYAFTNLLLNKIYLYTEVENTKAQYLFEKIGFIKEGLLKNDIIYKNKNVSRYVYGIFK